MVSPNPVQGFTSSTGANASGTNGGTPSRGIQVAAVCSPAITGIQINEQTTNTILAGMSGSMSILGSCLSGITAVGADGTGLSFSTISSAGDGQVNVGFDTLDSARGGVHNVTVTGPNGTNSTSTAAQVFVTRVTLQRFSFSNSIAHARDCAGNGSYIDEPSWPPTPNPVKTYPFLNACPPVGLAGDPAVYASGDTMHGTAFFAFNPVPPQGIPALSVQGRTSGLNGTFSQIGSLSSSGGTATFSASVSVDRPFGSSFTQLIDPLNVDWSVDIASLVVGDCITCASTGTSSNRVYVTLDHPLPAVTPLVLSWVKLAVGNGGASSRAMALANTWAQFSTGNGPADVKTWDGRTMSYYTTGFFSCATNAVFVVMNLFLDSDGNFQPGTSAQCGAFALLLESALAVNGIHSNWITVEAAYQVTQDPEGRVRMVIKNWCLIGAAECPGTRSYPFEANYKYNFILNSGDFILDKDFKPVSTRQLTEPPPPKQFPKLSFPK